MQGQHGKRHPNLLVEGSSESSSILAGRGEGGWDDSLALLALGAVALLQGVGEVELHHRTAYNASEGCKQKVIVNKQAYVQASCWEPWKALLPLLEQWLAAA